MNTEIPNNIAGNFIDHKNMLKLFTSALLHAYHTSNKEKKISEYHVAGDENIPTKYSVLHICNKLLYSNH